MPKSKSAYSSPSIKQKSDTYIFVVWVDNEAGVLARVVGLFSGRGYNIESLAVAEIDAVKNISRITIVTTGTPQVIDQIRLQLTKLVPVHKVAEFKRDDKDVIFKEMAISLKITSLSSLLNSATLCTGTNLVNCSLIWSITCGVPVVTIVILEMFLTASISATANDSIL